MNPTEKQTTTEHAKVDPDILRQIVEEMEAQNPYGGTKYNDQDAISLGIDSLGGLRLANQLVKAWWGSPMIPKWIQSAPNPSGTFVSCILRGKELGFKMMESLQALYLSPDGRLGLYGTAMISLMRKSGISLVFTTLEDDRGNQVGVQVKGTRKDGDSYTSNFTLTDAATAGLGNVHKKYPIVMCKWRAVSDLFRTLASDLSGGPLYTREELEEELREQGYHSTEDASVLTREPEQNPFKVTAEPPAEVPVPPNSHQAFIDKARELNMAKQSSSQGPGGTGIPAEVSPSPLPEGGDTPAPEPPAEAPTKRGRGRAPAKEPDQAGPVAVPEPPKPTNVVEMPATGFQATDADLPAELLAKKQEIPQLERIFLVIDALAKGIPRDDPRWGGTKQQPGGVKDKVQQFMKAFLQVPRLPVPQRSAGEPADETYERLIPVLESMANLYGGKLTAEPEKAGLESGAGYGKLVRHIDKWPADLKAAALDTAIAVYPDSPYDLIDFIELKPAVEGDHNLMVFLGLMKRSRAIAAQVRMFANANTMEMADIMVGLNLATCTEGEILGRLTGGLSSLDKPVQEGIWE